MIDLKIRNIYQIKRILLKINVIIGNSSSLPPKYFLENQKTFQHKLFLLDDCIKSKHILQ